jgi:hypothetical protein
VTSYSDFDKLAHGPRGHNAKHTLRTYRFLPDGGLVLLHIGGEGSNVINPAFSRFHPRCVREWHAPLYSIFRHHSSSHHRRFFSSLFHVLSVLVKN